jgi:hypothetical protein
VALDPTEGLGLSSQYVAIETNPKRSRSHSKITTNITQVPLRVHQLVKGHDAIVAKKLAPKNLVMTLDFF